MKKILILFLLIASVCGASSFSVLYRTSSGGSSEAYDAISLSIREMATNAIGSGDLERYYITYNLEDPSTTPEILIEALNAYFAARAPIFVFNETTHYIEGFTAESPRYAIIPETINGVEVWGIADNAFSLPGNEAIEIDFSSICDNFTYIGASAFTGSFASSVTIPAIITNIGDSAFSTMPNLTSFYVYSDTVTYGINVVDPSPTLTMYGNPMSTTETYAGTNGIIFLPELPPQ